MAGSLNQVTIIGNVGRDPETRTFPNGGKVTNFSVGVSESWKDKKTGEWKNNTEWFNVSITNPTTVDYVERSIKKGASVYIQGQMKTRKYKNQNGEEKSVTELVVPPYGGQVMSLDKREQGERSSGSSRNTDSKPADNSAFDLDDSIPF